MCQPGLTLVTHLSLPVAWRRAAQPAMAHFRFRGGLLALVLACTTFGTWAQESAVGYIKSVQAQASVVAGGQTLEARPGMPLQLGNTIRTGPNASVGVTFKDNTTMALGPGTELVIDEYLFSPQKGDLKLAASLTRGTLYYISGVIAKLKPESVSVRTPTGLIGVRGTQFLAKVDPKDQE